MEGNLLVSVTGWRGMLISLGRRIIHDVGDHVIRCVFVEKRILPTTHACNMGRDTNVDHHVLLNIILVNRDAANESKALSVVDVVRGSTKNCMQRWERECLGVECVDLEFQSYKMPPF